MSTTPPTVVLSPETAAPAAPDFDTAFATFSAPEGQTAPEPTPAPAPETTPEPEQAAPEPEATPEPEPAPEPTPEPAVEKPPAESDEALLARLAALVGKPPAQAAPAPQPESVQATPQPAPAIFTEAETKFLQEYEQEWGEVSRGEALKRRAETQALVEYLFTEIANELRPLAQGYQELQAAARMGVIQSKVPAYETVKADVAKWAEAQPAYLRSAYQSVLQSGNAEDIADLVARYTKETGTAPTPAPVVKPATELPSSAKQAAAALAPVSSKRSTVATADVDRNDFDGAFAKFAGSSN